MNLKTLVPLLLPAILLLLPALASDIVELDEALEKRLRQSPNDQKVRVDVANKYADKKGYNRAAEIIREGIALPGGHTPGMYHLLNTNLELANEFNEQLKAAEQGSKEFPKDGQLAMDNTIALMHLSRYKEAIAAAEQARKQVPASATDIRALYTNLIATSMFQDKQYASAIPLFDSLLKQAKPISIEHWLSMRGYCLYKTGKFQQALADFDRAEKVNPTFAATYEYRVQYYEQTHQYDKAAAELSKVVKLKPNDKDTLKHRAELYEKAGQKALAAKDRRAYDDYKSNIEDLLKPLK